MILIAHIQFFLILNFFFFLLFSFLSFFLSDNFFSSFFLFSFTAIYWSVYNIFRDDLLFSFPLFPRHPTSFNGCLDFPINMKYMENKALSYLLSKTVRKVAQWAVVIEFSNHSWKYHVCLQNGRKLDNHSLWDHFSTPFYNKYNNQSALCS